MPEEFSNCPYGLAVRLSPRPGIGGNLELVDVTRQPAFIDTWNPGWPPMPAINEEAVPWNPSR
ncbi:hypothetical protein [Streptomyces sp. SYSU K217416]